MKYDFDVIVVGGGHAGCEAALACARMGARTLMVVSSIDSIGKMPCNPAIGGLAKSHLVYEIDALGGAMGRIADASALQSKILNSSKGPAVQATRVQCAKEVYAAQMQKTALSQINLEVVEKSATALLVAGNSARSDHQTASNYPGSNDKTIGDEREFITPNGVDTPGSNAFTMHPDKLAHPESVPAAADNTIYCQSDKSNPNDGQSIRVDSPTETRSYGFINPTGKNQDAESVKSKATVNSNFHDEASCGAWKKSIMFESPDSGHTTVCYGVETEDGQKITAKTVILATGTALNGVIWIGKECKRSAGDNRAPISGLSEQLKSLGHTIRRFKTGTPPRLYADSCDFSLCKELKGDLPRPLFHVEQFNGCSTWNNLREASCWMTHTTAVTKAIIESNLGRSALYGGEISGTGVRYCPSIEDKIVRFKSVESHHVILEPENADCSIIYPNGLSCCLPRDVQEKMVHSVPGLENARFQKYAYAIEYDLIDSRELNHSLESRKCSNLFFAGQINGTTGYEEAAAQGIVAGINAALKTASQNTIRFSRTTSYIGLLIDDLTVKGTQEPYRMFTSRSENRLSLRQDNARFRMLPYAAYCGLVSEPYVISTSKTQSFLENLVGTALADKINNSTVDASIENFIFSNPIVKMWFDMKTIKNEFNVMRLYEPYIRQERKMAENVRKLEHAEIPAWIDYDKCSALRYESREKLKFFRPRTLHDASSISGVNPTDIMLLSIIIKGGKM